jgi:hypothetical protein
VRYIQADIANIDYILAEADTFFGNMRHVGICIVGIAHFIDDQTLRHTLQQLYEWAAPGAQIALSFAANTGSGTTSDAITTQYRGMEAPIYLRSVEDIRGIIQPWQPLYGDMHDLTTYLPPGTTLDSQPEQISMIGGIVYKPEA